MHALLLYPALPLSFWSFPKIIELHGAKALSAPLGPITVAALLPADWDIKFIDLNVRELTEEDWLWADIIMLSGMIVQRHELKKIIKDAKRRSKLTVAGGPYPSLMPDELIEAGCDFVVRGEAENTMHLLLDVIHSGNSGQIIENNEKPDLAVTPLPRYDLIHLDDYLQFLVQTTRGCPFGCEFCDIAGLYGKQPRCKSPDQIISELEYLFQLGARGDVLIADDNFIANTMNAKALCRKLIEWNRKHREPFAFSTQASVNLGQDMEMIDLMTSANFGEVFIGIETPDEDILKANEKYQNVGNPLVESIDTITRNGLSIIGSFIIGFDNEKKGAGKRICDFVERTNIPIIMPNVLSAPPGTKLWHRLIKEGRCTDKNLQLHTGETNLCLPNFTPTRPVEEIMEEYIEIWEYLYHPRRFLERTYKYCLAIRPTRRALAAEKNDPSASEPAFTRNIPITRYFRDMLVFLHHVWIHGIVSSHKLQFWKQLYGIRKHNPSRLRKYIGHCICGESHLQMSATIRQTINDLQAEHKRNNRSNLPGIEHEA